MSFSKIRINPRSLYQNEYNKAICAVIGFLFLVEIASEIVWWHDVLLLTFQGGGANTTVTLNDVPSLDTASS